MALDFSSAPVAQAAGPALSFEEVATGLLGRGLDAIRYILPGGRLEGGEYCIGSLNGERGKSLKVNPKTGRWSDFAGTDKGGDLVSLWAAKHGLSQEDARDEAAAWLGIDFKVKTQPQHAAWPKPENQPQDVKNVPLPVRAGDIVYEYTTAEGAPYLTVIRSPDKRFSQWTPQPDGQFTKGAPSAPRLLYNLRVLQERESEAVVVVEGEKKVHALAEVGILATTCVGGASGVKMADWSALKGRRVVIWHDNDAPGEGHAAAVEAELAKHGATLLGRVDVAGRPPKWDSADATPGDRRRLVEAVIASAPKPTPPFNPEDWDMTRYQGEPSPRRFLVEGMLPLGKAGIVAAMGDTGKSMMLLDLALSIATCSPADLVPNNYAAPTALGGRLLECGTAVILSAEDDQDELHARLNGIDPEGARRHKMDPRRLRIIPFPNAGGTVPLIQQVRDRLETTERFTVLRKWFKTLPDLKLIVVDPLAAFVQAALDADNAAAAFTMSVFGAIASETGACLVVAHHMRKPDKPIVTAADARSAVRGATGLVDNGRFTYALWPAPDQQASDVCKRLGIDDKPNTIVRGAIVKSNGPADRTIKLFARDPKSGLLVDRTESEKAKRREHDGELIDALAAAVGAYRAGTGKTPFTAYGKGGLVARRDELGEQFTGMGKTKLESLVSQALKAGKIRKDNDGYLHAGD